MPARQPGIDAMSSGRAGAMPASAAGLQPFGRTATLTRALVHVMRRVLDGFLNIHTHKLYQSICIDRFNLNCCVRLYLSGKDDGFASLISTVLRV